ncbi:MAG: M6 family metalloprotease domain-containing protein [Muribaculaceae bacterium]|nr:M6 family metalloprotease domain-containing protein [Muribaculaceae bacterium]
MKHIFCLISSLCLSIPGIYAVVAKPGFIDVRQPDGTMITIRMDGGPRGHNIYNTDDQIMRIDEKGFYVVADEDFKRNVTQKRNSRLDAKRNANGLMSDPFPSTGQQKALVILVEFPDVQFTLENPKEYYEGMLNGEDFREYLSTGSARQYFLENSGRKFDITFDIIGPITLEKSAAYYGENDYWGEDRRPYEMIVDACDILYENGMVNFADYDKNNDGQIDNVYVFYAGYGEADGGGPDTIWPHSWDMTDAGVNKTYDGFKLNHYACSNELQYHSENKMMPDGIGTFCHEFCHVLGLPDFYSTIGGGAFTPENWTLLDSGSYNNMSRTPPFLSAYERYVFGWLDPVDINTTDFVRLQPIGDCNEAYIIRTENKNEYFILENRQQKDWDRYIPHHGMLVWHIDFNQRVWDNNTVNVNPRHQYVDLVEADGIPSNWTRDGDAFPGLYEKTELSASTTPALISWSGKPIDVTIRNIHEDENGNINFIVGDDDIPTGVDIVNCQEENLPRYFNLEGIEILNPASGQILIEKKGTSVRKVIF